MVHVKLKYFKSNGKYYSEGELDLDVKNEFWDVINRVINMIKGGNRPGLVDSFPKDTNSHKNEFNCLITVYTEYGLLDWLYIED